MSAEEKALAEEQSKVLELDAEADDVLRATIAVCGSEGSRKRKAA